jgi:hypothetical protein
MQPVTALPGFNGAYFHARPVAAFNLIFSNLEKQISDEGCGLLVKQKRPKYAQSQRGVRVAAQSVSYWF